MTVPRGTSVELRVHAQALPVCDFFFVLNY